MYPQQGEVETEVMALDGLPTTLFFFNFLLPYAIAQTPLSFLSISAFLMKAHLHIP